MTNKDFTLTMDVERQRIITYIKDLENMHSKTPLKYFRLQIRKHISMLNYRLSDINAFESGMLDENYTLQGSASLFNTIEDFLYEAEKTILLYELL